MKRARASGNGEAARREGVPLEEEAGQRKGIGEIGGRRRLSLRAQEIGQPHQLVAVGFARPRATPRARIAARRR